MPPTILNSGMNQTQPKTVELWNYTKNIQIEMAEHRTYNSKMAAVQCPMSNVTCDKMLLLKILILKNNIFRF